jgi:aquaporin Z
LKWRELPGYVLAQLVGGILASGLLLAILKGQPGGYDAATSGLAANGYGAHSPGGYSLAAGFLCEVLLTFIFLSVILGTTSRRAIAASPEFRLA